LFCYLPPFVCSCVPCLGQVVPDASLGGKGRTRDTSLRSRTRWAWRRAWRSDVCAKQAARRCCGTDRGVRRSCVPGPALTSAALYSCSPRLRMESPILPCGRAASARHCSLARRGRLRRCQASAAGRTLGVMRFVITDAGRRAPWLRPRVEARNGPEPAFASRRTWHGLPRNWRALARRERLGAHMYRIPKHGP
jgi:hypothetical protein